MGFLIKAAAGYGALADFILTGGRRGFAKGTGNFNAALAEQLAQINRAQKHGTKFNGGAIDSLENYQLQGWLRSLAENGTLNASDARALGLVGPIKPVKAWTPRAMQNFIATARKSIADKKAAQKFYAMLNDGQKLSAGQMSQASDVLYVKVLEHLAALRKRRRQTLTMRDAALARYLANDPRLLRGSDGAIDIANQLAAGRTNFNRDFRNAVRGGFDEYLATVKAKPNTPVPPKKPGTQPDTDITVRPATASDALPNTEPNAQVFKDKNVPVKEIDLSSGKKTPKSKPGLLRWRNLGIGGLSLGLGGGAWYAATRPGEVSADEEARSRSEDVPLPTQDAEWNNTARAYYDRLRGDSSLQNQLYNVGMTSPSSLQRNFGNQFNYLFGSQPGVPLPGSQPGVPIRLYQ